MPITALPTPPSPSDSPSVFETRATAFVAALPAFRAEANAIEAALTASAHTGTSTNSLTIGTGSRSMTTQTGKAWIVGGHLYVINSASVANYMVGQITAYNAGTGALTIDVSTTGGSGTASTWALALATPPGTITGLSGGSVGAVPYQSGVGTTAMLAAGTADHVLQSNGAGAPSWTGTPKVGGFRGGYLGAPQNKRTAAYTLVVSDSGKSVPNTTGGWTVPSAVLVAEDVVVLVNESGTAQTVTQGAGMTLRQGGTTNTGARTVAPWGMATVYFLSGSVAIINGNIT